MPGGSGLVAEDRDQPQGQEQQEAAQAGEPVQPPASPEPQKSGWKLGAISLCSVLLGQKGAHFLSGLATKSPHWLFATKMVLSPKKCQVHELRERGSEAPLNHSPHAQPPIDNLYNPSLDQQAWVAMSESYDYWVKVCRARQTVAQKKSLTVSAPALTSWARPRRTHPDPRPRTGCRPLWQTPWMLRGNPDFDGYGTIWRRLQNMYHNGTPEFDGYGLIWLWLESMETHNGTLGKWN